MSRFADLIAGGLKQPIPGVRLDAVFREGGEIRLSAVVGPDLGQDIVVWYTHISPQAALQGEGTFQAAIARPIDALAKVVNDSYDRGFDTGMKAGKKAAQDELAVAARTLANALGLRAG